MRAQFQNLNEEQRNKAWIEVPPDLDKRPPNRTYFHLIWWRYLDLTEQEVLGCWRPPLEKIRENPMNMLLPKVGTPGLPQPKTREEEYERYYVVLTCIHDNILPGCEPINNSIWPKKLAEEIWFRLTGGQPYGPDRHFIETALVRVRVDFVEKEEAERESQRGKFGFHSKKSSES